MGQYTRLLKAKLEAHTNLHQVYRYRDDDYIELPNTIQGIVYNFEIQKHKHNSLFEANKCFSLSSSVKPISVDDYYDIFNNNV